MNAFGNDRRRRLSLDERRELYVRAGGTCQRCHSPLEPGWHAAHLLAWTHGGATSLDQMEAWCPPCNLREGAGSTYAPDVPQPRMWQKQALEVILDRLYRDGVATLHAAPGAGKTLFAGMVFRWLASAGLATRMVVVVPTVALIRQWTEALALLGIHLDYEPYDGYLEHQKSVGAVVTYQGLPNTAKQHAFRMTEEPTLVVLDEVHHVADEKSWGTAVTRMVGDPSLGERHAAGVLNMTGTLFRSNSAHRIGTVRYEKINVDGIAKLQAQADFSVQASQLIGIELRRPDLYVYGGRARLVDLHKEVTIDGDIADLEDRQSRAVVKGAFTDYKWAEQFAREALRMLQQQLETIGHKEPLKLLYVAHDIKAAKMAAAAINKLAGQNFARLITSQEPHAVASLRNAAKERSSCAIVAVKMVTEGFDCPEVSVIAYASNVTATLFVAQMMARAMRVTQTERRDRRMLPAQILIPDVQQLRSAFASALIGHFHILDVPRDDELPLIQEDGAGDELLRMPRYEVVDVSAATLNLATVLGEPDGDVPACELEVVIELCREVGIPEPYAPRVGVVARRSRASVPLLTPTSSVTTTVTAHPTDPRTMNKLLREQMTQCARWTAVHIDHDSRYSSVAVFQAKANEAAGIGKGGRSNASHAQLQACLRWMVATIRQHCHTHGEVSPSWLEADAGT